MVGRIMAVDDQSEINFSTSIPQGTLPQQPIFVGLSYTKKALAK